MVNFNVINKKNMSKDTIYYEIIIDKIRNYKYVSFDLFDTVLKRNVGQPTDVFDLVNNLEDVKINGFKKRRIDAEKTARKMCLTKEVTIEDIYSYFECDIKDKIDLVRDELKIEGLVLTLNRDILPILDFCKKEKKIIYFISDMYLPIEFLRSILKREKLNFYEGFFLSNDIGRIKRDGTLFKYVLDSAAISPNEIIHVGDSMIADFMGAKKAGIKCIKIPKYVNHKSFQLNNKNNILGINIINAIYNNHCDNNSFYYKYGFERFGLLLWTFTEWLYNELANRSITKVLFFSRDGLVLKQAFDLCYPDSMIVTDYLEVSRRSLRVPCFWINSSYQYVIESICTSKTKNLRAIFDGFGLDIENYYEIIDQYGYTTDSVFNMKSLLNDKKFMLFYNEVRNDIISNSRREFLNLKKYLINHKVEGKFAVVDIGWAGSMQRYLQEVLDLLKINNDITGFYMGVTKECKRNLLLNPKLDINGYLFDFSKKNIIKEKDIRNGFVGLFESFFMHFNGSVKNYIPFKEEVYVNKYLSEYFVDGVMSREAKAIVDIQKGALDFIKIIKNIPINVDEINKSDVINGIYKTGVQPTRKELESFSNFCFFDDGVTSTLAQSKSIFYYIKHPIDFKFDLLKCRWKIGFLKNVFKIRLPYLTIYNILKKIGG